MGIRRTKLGKGALEVLSCSEFGAIKLLEELRSTYRVELPVGEPTVSEPIWIGCLDRGLIRDCRKDQEDDSND